MRGSPLMPASFPASRHRVLQPSELVHQLQLLRLPPGEDAAVGHLAHLLLGQLPRLGHRGDELVVHVVEHGLEVRALLRRHLPERAAGVLQLPGGDGAHVHARPLEQPGDVGELGDDADAAGQRAGVGEHLLRRPSRCRSRPTRRWSPCWRARASSSAAAASPRRSPARGRPSRRGCRSGRRSRGCARPRRTRAAPCSVVLSSPMTPVTSTTPTRSPPARAMTFPPRPLWTATQARAMKAKRQRKRPPKTRPRIQAARRSM